MTVLSDNAENDVQPKRGYRNSLTLDARVGRWTLDAGHSGRWTLDSGLWTLDS